ncbi:hypothetical protein WME_02302 [Enterococcus faecalis EnGen0362]|uniref:type II toxin-antitoxin system RelE family toxin n=1 Tax=Enterococcus faecalis TaxID=1351 RepID=UPI00032DA76A|nr:hypothetical protein [Enterococcus faecalis]EOL35514.1 hypothetical protein WME_02302 [Enterococcus faecalis EnGen0362]
MDEETTEIVLQLVYKLINDKDDLINENGEIVVDKFYKELLADIDQADGSFQKQPLKFLQNLDAKTKQRIINAIYSLPDGDVKPLQGYKLYKRLKVSPYRIIFEEAEDNYIIVKIGNRSDVYKR